MALIGYVPPLNPSPIIWPSTAPGSAVPNPNAPTNPVVPNINTIPTPDPNSGATEPSPTDISTVSDPITALADAIGMLPSELSQDALFVQYKIFIEAVFAIAFLVTIYVLLTGQTDVGKAINDYASGVNQKLATVGKVAALAE